MRTQCRHLSGTHHYVEPGRLESVVQTEQAGQARLGEAESGQEGPEHRALRHAGEQGAGQQGPGVQIVIALA